MKQKLLCTFILLMSTFQVLAQDNFALVKIGQAESSKDKIVFFPTQAKGLNEGAKKKLTEVIDILQNDFLFYKKKFEVIKSYSELERSTSLNWDQIQGKGIGYVGAVKAAMKSTELMVFEVKLYRVRDKSTLLELDFDVALTSKNIRGQIHEQSDLIYQKIVKKESIFNSQILFVSDKTSVKDDIRKELYIMDFDGKNIRQLTFHKGTVIGPALSRDGQQVLYSLIHNKGKNRNVNLHYLDLRTGESSLLSSKDGLNAGAVFMPDNENVLLTLTHSGNAEIYALNIKTKNLRKITNHYAPDVDPSINADGNLMTFLSGRSGSPNIYTASPDGMEKNIKRISFVGKFNATPRFSPDGKHIAFASWLDNRFDIFRIDADGSNLYRLTKDFGSNEDPTYSNDGEFIAFSSQRVLSRTKATHSIYVMDKEGDVIGAVVQSFGNCITPRWSR